MEFFEKVRLKNVATNRVYLSIGSKICSIFICIMTFFFLAFPTFINEYITFVPGTGTVTITEKYNGYKALMVPFFEDFAFFFILLVMIISVIIILFMTAQIYFRVEYNSMNIVLFGLLIISMEFLCTIIDLDGYLLFTLYIINYMQYFFLLGKRKEIDVWVFASMIVLAVAIVPSALALSRLYN